MRTFRSASNSGLVLPSGARQVRSGRAHSRGGWGLRRSEGHLPLEGAAASEPQLTAALWSGMPGVGAAGRGGGCLPVCPEKPQIFIILIKIFLMKQKILLRATYTSDCRPLPTSHPSTGCRPSGPPGGGALSLAASYWPVELVEVDLSSAAQQPRTGVVVVTAGWAAKARGEGLEGCAPSRPHSAALWPLH